MKKKVITKPRLRPKRPAFISHNLLAHAALLDFVGPVLPLDFVVLKPGIRIRHVMAMMPKGATSETRNSTAGEIFSLSVYGKEMDGSDRVKGRRLPVVSEKRPPTAAMMLGWRVVSS